MNKKLSILGPVLAVIAIAAVVVTGTAVPVFASEAVHVAVNLPLSGPLAYMGQPFREGAMLANEELQKAKAKPELIFDWGDNGGSPQTAVTVMQQQFLKKVDVYFSGFKPQLMAIREQVSARGTPNFNCLFDMFINKNSTNNLRVTYNYKNEAALLISYAKERKAKRVAIAYYNLPHAAEEFETAVIPALVKQGINRENIFVEAFDIRTKDFKTIANKIYAFKPDLTILSGFSDHLVGLVRSIRPLFDMSKGDVIGSLDMIEVAVPLGADEIEGIRMVTPQFISRPDQPRLVEWKKRFYQKYGKEPHPHALLSNAIVTIIHDTAKRLSLPATSAQWIDAFRATDIEGVAYRLRFDEDGSVPVPCEIGVFRNGKVVPNEN